MVKIYDPNTDSPEFYDELEVRSNLDIVMEGDWKLVLDPDIGLL